MKTFLKWLPAAAALAFFSCKNEAPKPAAPTAEALKTEGAKPVFEKPEAIFYVVALDKFRLRETPDPKGKELLLMPKGAKLEATGRLGDQKFDIELNGIPQGPEPFVEGASGGKTGWAYRPGLLKVFSGKKADAPDEAFWALAAEIGKLPAGQLESGRKALDLARKSATKSGDAAFLLVEKTLRDLMFSPKVSGIFETPKVKDALEKEGEAVWKDAFDHSKLPETKAAAEAGFRVETTEGMFFPAIDYLNLQKIFAGKLSPAMQKFVELTTVDAHENAISDGGLVIEIAEYAERAVKWSDFEAQNPNFVSIEDVRRDAHWRASDLMFGQNNTPAFDYETLAISPEFKAAWDIVFKKAPASELAKTIKTFSDLVASEGGKKTKKVEDWMADFHKKAGVF